MNDSPPGGVRKAAAGGVMVTASSQGARQVIQIGITVILARYLAPGDFGLISMAAVTLAFVAPFNELGLGAALVQRKEVTSRHASTVFWSQITIATVAALVVSVAAPFIASFFSQQQLTAVLRIMCWNLPIGAAAAAPQAMLLRRLSFGRVAAVETMALAGAGAVGVGMAIMGWGLWSLVGQALTGSLLTAVLLIGSARFNPLAPSARPGLRYARELSRFSAPLAGYQILNFASRNIDDILIGRFLGAEALGYYSMAYRVMMYPLEKVSGIVGRVSFPTFSSLQDDVARIRRGYLKAVGYIALITFPMMATVMVVAPELTRTLFGPAWDPVAPLIAILSLAGMTGSIATTAGSLFLARGRSDLMLKWEIVASLSFTAAIVAGLSHGLQGVAVCYTGMALVLWPISQTLANRLIGLPAKRFFGALVSPALFAAILGIVLFSIRWAWLPSGPLEQGALLGTSAIIFVAAFVAAALLGRPDGVREMLVLLKETILGFMAARPGTAR